MLMGVGRKGTVRDTSFKKLIPRSPINRQILLVAQPRALSLQDKWNAYTMPLG